jgi:hypothetical protein
MGVYTDVMGTNCNIVETPGVLYLYVVHTGTSGTLTSSWSAPKPACMTGATWLADIDPGWLIVIGDPQTGVEIAYGTCQMSPVLVWTILYNVSGGSPICCEYPILPHPSYANIEATDCSHNVMYPEASVAKINGDGSCPCGVPGASIYGGPQGVVGSGGGDGMVSASYGTRGTVGQLATGTVGSSTYGCNVGYWYMPYSAATGASGDRGLPKILSLDQNFPNPFNPTTQIRFTLPEPSHVTLKLYDVKGSLVMTIVDEDMPAGVHQEVLDAGDIPSGVYFYRIRAGGFTQAKKLVVLK